MRKKDQFRGENKPQEKDRSKENDKLQEKDWSPTNVSQEETQQKCESQEKEEPVESEGSGEDNKSQESKTQDKEFDLKARLLLLKNQMMENFIKKNKKTNSDAKEKEVGCELEESADMETKENVNQTLNCSSEDDLEGIRRIMEGGGSTEQEAEGGRGREQEVEGGGSTEQEVEDTQEPQMLGSPLPPAKRKSTHC